MAEPIVVPLSAPQIAQLAAYGEQERQLAQLRNAVVTAILGATMDPATLAGHGIQFDGTAIVITPTALAEG